MRINIKSLVFLLLGLVSLGACKDSQAPHFAKPNVVEEEKTVVALSGTFNMPEWVDLEDENEDIPKAFTLRPNKNGYPKIRLSGIEDDNKAFESFPSSVWLYKPGKVLDLRIDVEDHEGEKPVLTGTNQSFGSTAARRGVSRIIKKGDKYHVLVKYEVSNKQGQATPSPTGDSYPKPYPTGTRAFVAFNHHHNPQPGSSIHRLYMPKLHNTTNGTIPQLDALQHVSGDYVVAEAGAAREASKRFKLPFMSKYADLSTLVSGTEAFTTTNFYMAGALLALKFKNQTGRNITVNKIHVKSDNLAFSGFYELWSDHPDMPTSGTLPSAQRTRPFFARSDGKQYSQQRRNATYQIDIKNDAGGSYLLSTTATTTGRFYLWGGIDEATGSGSTTRVQVEYTARGASTKSKVIDITPKAGAKKFEEGKAYIITIPIQAL